MEEITATRGTTKRHVGEKHRATPRVAAAIILMCASALVWLEQLEYRGWEAWAAGHLTQAVGDVEVLVNQAHAAFYVGIYSPDVFGATITAECTSALVTLGILGTTAVLMMSTRLGMGRLTVAAVVATSTFIVLNLVRVVGIALATRQWGTDAGFHWSHVWGGTLVTVFGGVGVCMLYLLMLGVRSRPGSQR